MAGSHDAFMQAEPKRHIPLWPVVGSLFVTWLVTSGVSSFLIGTVTPLGQLGGGPSRVSTLGLYVVVSWQVFSSVARLPPWSCWRTPW